MLAQREFNPAITITYEMLNHFQEEEWQKLATYGADDKNPELTFDLSKSMHADEPFAEDKWQKFLSVIKQFKKARIIFHQRNLPKATVIDDLRLQQFSEVMSYIPQLRITFANVAFKETKKSWGIFCEAFGNHPNFELDVSGCGLTFFRYSQWHEFTSALAKSKNLKINVSGNGDFTLMYRPYSEMLFQALEKSTNLNIDFTDSLYLSSGLSSIHDSFWTALCESMEKANGLTITFSQLQENYWTRMLNAIKKNPGLKIFVSEADSPDEVERLKIKALEFAKIEYVQAGLLMVTTNITKPYMREDLEKLASQQSDFYVAHDLETLDTKIQKQRETRNKVIDLSLLRSGLPYDMAASVKKYLGYRPNPQSKDNYNKLFEAHAAKREKVKSHFLKDNFLSIEDSNAFLLSLKKVNLPIHPIQYFYSLKDHYQSFICDTVKGKYKDDYLCDYLIQIGIALAKRSQMPFEDLMVCLNKIRAEIVSINDAKSRLERAVEFYAVNVIEHKSLQHFHAFIAHADLQVLSEDNQSFVSLCAEARQFAEAKVVVKELISAELNSTYKSQQNKLNILSIYLQEVEGSKNKTDILPIINELSQSSALQARWSVRLNFNSKFLKKIEAYNKKHFCQEVQPAQQLKR